MTPTCCIESTRQENVFLFIFRQQWFNVFIKRTESSSNVRHGKTYLEERQDTFALRDAKAKTAIRRLYIAEMRLVWSSITIMVFQLHLL